MKNHGLRAVTGMFLCIICVQFFAGTCAAQTEGESMWGMDVHSAVLAPSKVMDTAGSETDGEMGCYSVGTGIGMFGIGLGYTYTAFSWDHLADLPFGNGKDDPWQGLHAMSIGYELSDMFNDNWGWFASAGASSQFEKQTGDSLGATGIAGVIYAIPDMRLMFRLGGGVSHDPLETEAIPVFGIDWNSMAETGLTVSAGMPTQVAWRFTPDMSIALVLGMGNGGVFRLADDSIVEKKGYLRMEDTGALLMFTFSPMDHCSITLGGGMTLDRELEIYDRDGENKREYELENSAGGFFSINFEF